MKTEDERVLQTFCNGKAITHLEFLTSNKLKILFDSNVGIEISEPRAGAKGLVIRIIHLRRDLALSRL